MAKRKWSDLSTARKTNIVLAGTLQIGLLAAALIDIYGRPEEEIQGSKRLWTAVTFVNFVGPVSYFLFGRNR